MNNQLKLEFDEVTNKQESQFTKDPATNPDLPNPNNFLILLSNEKKLIPNLCDDLIQILKFKNGKAWHDKYCQKCQKTQ